MREVTHDPITQRFNALYSNYAPFVRRMVARVLINRHDADMVEDTAQEVWLKIWRAVSATPDMTILPAWIATVASNAARDALRRKYRTETKSGTGRLAPSSLDDAALTLIDEREEGSDPQELTIVRETIAELYAEIPATYHPHIKLRAMGYRHQEIEEVMRCAHSTVRTALDRRRKRKAPVR